MQQPLWKTVWQFLKELNKYSPCDPEISLLSTYPREIKIHVHIKTCMWMFIVALFIIIKLKSIQMSINCGMDKQKAIYPINEILFHSKKGTNY